MQQLRLPQPNKSCYLCKLGKNAIIDQIRLYTDKQRRILPEEESEELLKLVNDITNIITNHRNKFDAHIILGDLNTDFDRISSAHVTTVNNFIFREQLSIL